MKRIVVGIIAFVLVFSLVGCATEGASSTETSESEKVVIDFSLWDKFQKPVMEEIAEKFTEENPDIEINIELTPYNQYWTKLETSATGGQLADVFWMNGPNFIKYASNDMILPISDYVEEEAIDLSVYPKGLIDLYTYEDELYGLPKDFDLTAMWYNKSLFDAAGIDYPTSDWTWEDMKEAARVITDHEKGIYGTTLQTDNQQGIYNTIPQSGGYVISQDLKTSGYGSEGTVQGIKVWKDLLDEGLSPSIEELSDSSPVDYFEAGNVAMIHAASWNVKRFMDNENINNQVDLIEMPMIDESAAVIHGLIPAISSKTDNEEAALKFIKYLGSKEANEIWAKSGTVIPAHKDVLDIWTKSYEQINLQAFVNQLEDSVNYPVSKDNKWSETERDTLRKIWNDKVSVEEGCKTIEKEMNYFLEREFSK